MNFNIDRTYIEFYEYFQRRRRCRDRMVVEFTTTNAIITYHH
jgi:hypothetical protein